MFSLNKEKVVALLSLVILALGIFDLIRKLEDLPKVPKMVSLEGFASKKIPLEKVWQDIGQPKFLPSSWKGSSFLRDPWKEIGLWRIPPLEKIEMPKPLPLKGFLAPYPFTPKGLPELPKWEAK